MLKLNFVKTFLAFGLFSATFATAADLATNEIVANKFSAVNIYSIESAKVSGENPDFPATVLLKTLPNGQRIASFESPITYVTIRLRIGNTCGQGADHIATVTSPLPSQGNQINESVLVGALVNNRPYQTVACQEGQPFGLDGKIGLPIDIVLPLLATTTMSYDPKTNSLVAIEKAVTSYRFLINKRDYKGQDGTHTVKVTLTQDGDVSVEVSPKSIL